MVYINPKSLLYEIVKLDSAKVNSLHHQAVENLANNLLIGAKAKDNITESIELKNKNLHPFVLGIQWHPELLDPTDPMAKPIAERFLKEVSAFRKK